MLSALVLDLDDTLVDHTSAAGAAIVSWAQELGLETLNPQACWAEISAFHYARYQRSELTFAQQRRERVRGFLGRELDDQGADACFDDYLARYEAAWRAYDDVVPALRRARTAGLRVGVLTNGDAEQQRAKVDRLDLAPRIDVLVASSDLPAGKPDPTAFRHITDLLGTAPEDTLMVGDSLTDDVLGALAAGLQAVLLDRHDRHRSVDVRRISSLDELLRDPLDGTTDLDENRPMARPLTPPTPRANS
ncbi:HAD family hydrolase [Nocardioides sp. HDW12B]|uniref:HAD family hydrolase n=1 Tax=Nocardioides sp. HDW12B TaxID=2714939 RepID=UPI00140A6757|nr:HAD family hydrolase [Nocardioides sp. HDW12B]QIK66466.1 HAD family hydrolase [Nocardioides sp. HDW12B]